VLAHWYGYKEADILALTPRQFSDRIHDVGEIAKMTGGEGKGRIRRDKKRHAELLRQYGKPVPKDW